MDDGAAAMKLTGGAGTASATAADAGADAPVCAVPLSSDARLSDTLKVLSSGCAGERISFDDLTTTLGDKCYSGLLFLLAAPNLLPLPPGASGVLGTALALLAAQLALGLRRPRFPRLLLDRGIATDKFAVIGERLEPLTRRAEAMLTRRLAPLTGLIARRVIGLICLVLAIVLALPIPFGNVVPAAAISLFALALLARDGVAAIAGLAATAATAAILYGLGYGAFEAVEWVTGRLG